MDSHNQPLCANNLSLSGVVDSELLLRRITLRLCRTPVQRLQQAAFNLVREKTLVTAPIVTQWRIPVIRVRRSPTAPMEDLPKLSIAWLSH